MSKVIVGLPVTEIITTRSEKSFKYIKNLRVPFVENPILLNLSSCKPDLKSIVNLDCITL